MSKAMVILCIVLNLIIAGVTVWVVIRQIGEGKREHDNPYYTFRYFTTLSNVYAALGAFAALICEVGMLSGTARYLPSPVAALVFSSAVSVAVTFVTVMVFLGPTQGYHDLVTGEGAHLHVVAPILSAIACCIECSEMPFRSVVWGILPVVAYSVLYYKRVISYTGKRDVWPDFYGFNRGGKWKRALILMYATVTALGILLWLGCR